MTYFWPSMNGRIFCYLLAFLCACSGCANISSPTGGKKDTRPPKLLSITPADSLLNTRLSRLEMHFDEYVTVADAQKEVIISPILTIPPTVTGLNKHVVLKLEDTLLEDNTTYRISFGRSIRDLHEGNAFSGFTYTFSTGRYFDSMELKGTIINAATGLPDTSGILVILYKAAENDSAVVKKKPMYAARPDNKGAFHFKGLPGRHFRIYALKDDNNNMIYDGGTEMIAFNDSLVTPADSAVQTIGLRLFAELPDTANSAKDSVKPSKKMLKGKMRGVVIDTNLVYTTNLDTTNSSRKTFDITDSIKMVFNRWPILAKEKISIIFDSAETEVRVPVRVRQDSSKPGLIYVIAHLAENTVYTMRVDTGFAKDTGNKSVSTARYKFRTFDKDDYGKIKLNLPGRYYSSKQGNAPVSRPDYLLMAMAGNDTLYRQKITDTVVFFSRLRPASYTFRIIVDKNRNGKWDTGDLLGKRQPEEVMPGPAPLSLKAGWEHNIDFETSGKVSDKKGLKDKVSPKK